MKNTEYAYAVAYIKTLENKMLNKNDYEVLISSPDVTSALKYITDNGYGNISAGEITLENLLESEQKKVWKEVESCFPYNSPLNILKYRNDFHNLKTVLKAFLTNSPWKELTLSPSIISPELIYESVKKANFSDLPEFLRESAKGAYEIITHEHNGQKAEIFIDKKAFEEMLKFAKGNVFLTEWIEKNIIFANFLTALRAKDNSPEFIKSALIPTDKLNLSKLTDAALIGKDAVSAYLREIGFDEGSEMLKISIGEFEKWCDNKKTEFIKTAKNKFFGFEPIIAFVLGKESEIQALRIIFSGIKNNVSQKIIRERLREQYV